MSGQKIWLAFGVWLAIFLGQAWAWEIRTVSVSSDEIAHIDNSEIGLSVHCALGYYYLIVDCGYVTVVHGIEENETFGIHFDMTECVPWYNPCDTSSCLCLDLIELAFYDALPLGNDQDMSLKVYGSDAGGEPTGDLLGNRDFAVHHSDTASFSVIAIDFTNSGAVEGLDLSSCGGDFVVLVTWKNATGHPALVLDNVSSCVDSCAVNTACCGMGSSPYTYPRTVTHTYFYGTEWSWSKQDSVCDPGDCGTYGWLEGLWTCEFCKWSTAVEPTTWGNIKSLYR